MLMSDEWFGHRNWYTLAPEGAKDEWLPEDFTLAQVYQLITDFTDQYGFLAWEVDDPQQRAYVDTKLDIDRVQQAIQSAENNRDTKAQLEKVKGSYVKPVLKLIKKDGEWPTHIEYFDSLVEDE